MRPQQSKKNRGAASLIKRKRRQRQKRRREDILSLRKQGLSYRKIQQKLGCSRSTISYHCGKSQSERKRVSNQKKNPLCRKVGSFKARCTATSWKHFRSKIKCFKRRAGDRWRVKVDSPYDCADVIEKLGKKPRCYLTGELINLEEPMSYSLDHINPVSKGGTNELNNLQITCASANSAKSNLTLDEFYKLCERVLRWRDINKRKARKRR
jgi:DNA-binding CsgD family transcriptional regulator